MIFDIPARRKIRLQSRSIHRHLSIRESVMNNCDLKRHATRASFPTAIVQRPVAQSTLGVGRCGRPPSLCSCGRNQSWLLAAGSQLIKIIRPLLHHHSPLRQPLRPVVRRSDRVSLSMSELQLNKVRMSPCSFNSVLAIVRNPCAVISSPEYPM
jgi:hypothetical protein